MGRKLATTEEESWQDFRTVNLMEEDTQPRAVNAFCGSETTDVRILAEPHSSGRALVH